MTSNLKTAYQGESTGPKRNIENNLAIYPENVWNASFWQNNQHLDPTIWADDEIALIAPLPTIHWGPIESAQNNIRRWKVVSSASTSLPSKYEDAAVDVP